MENQIKQSSDFTIFKKIEGNRLIKQSHINKLVLSIQEKNLLHLKPIIVNKDFYILDGQHRLEAARICNVPIFYIQIDSSAFREMSNLNHNQLNWSFKDYMNFFSTILKNENYIKLNKLCNTYELDVNSILLFAGEVYTKKEFKTKFFKGDFVFQCDLDILANRISSWRKLLEIFKEKNCDFLSFFNTSQFKSSWVKFTSSPKVNQENLFDKIKDNIPQFYPCYTQDQTIDMLLKVYNRKSPYVLGKEDL